MENNTINTISASLTVEEMVKTIKSDFLDRDSETFVKIRTDNRIGWEALIPRGEDLSDVVTGLSGQESKTDFIKGCYSAARDCIIAMDTPYKVSLELTNETNATDARKVYLETALFDDDQLSMSQKAATFLGLAVHEGSHLKYSDFNLTKKIDNDTVAHLDNIFEDERIERICGQEIPGFANFLKSAKYYKFYLYHKKMAATHVPKNLNDGVRLLNCILAMVRFPSMMNEDDLRQFAPYLYKVRELVTAYPGGYPSTPQENLQLAKDVYEVLKDFFKNNPSQPNQGNGTPKQQDGGQDGGQDAGEPLTDKEAETLVKVLTDAMGEAMQTLSATPQEDGGGLSEEQISKDVSRNDGLVAGICKNTVTLGLNPQAVIYKAENDREVYADSLSRVRRYVPAISKILRGHCEERTLIHRAQRSGQLDTWKIAEARQDVQSVYKRKGRITSDHISVAVLVDEEEVVETAEEVGGAEDLVLLGVTLEDVGLVDDLVGAVEPGIHQVPEESGVGGVGGTDDGGSVAGVVSVVGLGGAVAADHELIGAGIGEGPALGVVHLAELEVEALGHGVESFRGIQEAGVNLGALDLVDEFLAAGGGGDREGSGSGDNGQDSNDIFHKAIILR